MIDDIRGASKLSHAEDMATTTTRLRQCPRPPRTPRAALDALMGAIGDRLHREADLAARAAGLTVTRLPYGGREYRNPAMDALRDGRL
jgi:hypothetical protein